MPRSPIFRLGLAVLAAVLATTGLTAPAHADPDTGTLTGQLSNHAGRPIAEASVTVFDTEDFNDLGSVETDVDGRYTITDVAAGAIKVRFTRDGEDRWAGGTDYADAKVFAITAG
ncbi:MAG TPA: carboxypeptidase-like regulatory domain-containing protein, partial [Actinoplanes sp.]|nr:carboxypeptidase-like regulatory domain-containing protein [Actinoplanes sp.]